VLPISITHTKSLTFQLSRRKTNGEKSKRRRKKDGTFECLALSSLETEAFLFIPFISVTATHHLSIFNPTWSQSKAINSNP
jgi:hypothetical protein